MKFRLQLIASLVGLAAGCASPASSPIPTPIPPEQLPIVIAQTAEAANLAATETLIASLPTLAPTNSPARTLTITPGPSPTATSIPGHDRAEIEISSPGPFSKVISPITLKMEITTGASEIVQVDLFGEDGRLITRLLTKNVPTAHQLIWPASHPLLAILILNWKPLVRVSRKALNQLPHLVEPPNELFRSRYRVVK